MDQAEVDTYKRLNFFCQEQMKHRLKTAILNEDQTRGQRLHCCNRTTSFIEGNRPESRKLNAYLIKVMESPSIKIQKPKWFGKLFDRLTVLSSVEGLTTLSQIEGQITNDRNSKHADSS